MRKYIKMQDPQIIFKKIKCNWRILSLSLLLQNVPFWDSLFKFFL
jgi:hypothetical protein